jgi:hypothetical protein
MFRVHALSVAGSVDSFIIGHLPERKYARFEVLHPLSGIT